ncbi:ABC transporter ATP-binding protein [Anaerosporobacter sp.]|uniref:ABC transporter ATP-binding protein n=1 Tax=Anaerosporobacter sp. TaxID=1872529 RepID=UPI00286F9033|nr:ATP-binding cassette domain-containing protein [Anaerosporobacter sp.]
MEEIISKQQPIVETSNLTIQFGDFVANKAINIAFYEGSIHAIVGENGAGKSTLMKMLYGVYKPTEGFIKIKGKKVSLKPSRAIAAGIGMVFQDFRLIPAFTALENIRLALPKERQKEKVGELRKKILEISNTYKIPIDPDMYVWEMDLGQRQRVEIIKVMLMGDMRVLIFDEPTSVLTHHEAEAFIEMLKILRENGLSIVLITHKLHEVMACSDIISILRQGQITQTVRREDGFDKDRLIAQMMGEEELNIEFHDALNKKPCKEEGVALTCKNLTVVDEQGRKIIKDINLELRQGEILGVAGISGRGQKELLETLFGVRKAYSGSLIMNEKEMVHATVGERIKEGIALISEDPKRDNVVPGMSILEHFPLAGVEMKKTIAGVDWRTISSEVEQTKELKELRVPEVQRMMGTLSGGNIQRAVLARALMKKPKVLLASYPSRGLDVGTVSMVHHSLVRLRNEGASVLLVSEDLEEIFKVSDRIIVVADRKVLGKYNPQEITPLEIGERMIGGKAK